MNLKEENTLSAEKRYQVLYAVPSKREVSGECECTSTIPVVT